MSHAWNQPAMATTGLTFTGMGGLQVTVGKKNDHNMLFSICSIFRNAASFSNISLRIRRNLRHVAKKLLRQF
jgi:hypothetical protein